MLNPVVDRLLVVLHSLQFGGFADVFFEGFIDLVEPQLSTSVPIEVIVMVDGLGEHVL